MIPYSPHAAADRGSASTRRAAPSTSLRTSRSVNADGSGRGISGTGGSRVSHRVTPTAPATTTPTAARTSHALRPLSPIRIANPSLLLAARLRRRQEAVLLLQGQLEGVGDA